MLQAIRTDDTTTSAATAAPATPAAEPSTLTARLAAFAIGTPSAALGSRILGLAEAGAVDTVGCALAALEEPVVRVTAAAVADAPTGSAQGLSASVWGGGRRVALADAAYGGRRVALADAAYLNAIATHALDFDDNMPTLRGHPSTTLLPTALAVGEATGASGLDVLAAYAIGLEVAGKLGLTMGYGHYVRGWHPTGTVGIYGATAVAARLLGLTAAQLCHAWGLAASQTAGLTTNFGTMAKSFHAGHAARCAVQSALLARGGFIANPAIFDGPRSAIATYGGEGAEPLAPQLDRLGAPWEIENPGLYVKLWPCCYCSNRPIAGLLQLLRQHDIAPGTIHEIAVGFPPGTDAGLLKTPPDTGLAGKFSVEYTLAAAALDGKVTLATFTDALFHRPAVQALMARVRTYPVEDSRRFSSTVGYNDVAVDAPQGRFSLRVEETPGAPGTVTAADLDGKFLDCAQGALGAAGAAQALRLLRGLSSQADCRGLSDLLRQGAPA